MTAFLPVVADPHDIAVADALLASILEDMELQPPGPMMIIGDIDGDLAVFPTLHEKVRAWQLLDVGEHATKWGQMPKDYTCKAHGALQPTRRDYVIANPCAFKYISHFEVRHDAGLDVHEVIHLQLQWQGASQSICKAIKPGALGACLAKSPQE